MPGPTRAVAVKPEERDPPAKATAEARASEKRPTNPGLLDRLRFLFGLGGASIRDDIEDALEDGDTTGAFSPQEQAMLRNVLSLHEVRVEDVMVPRADVVAVGVDMTLAEVLAVFRSVGHSRLPVHGDTLDDPRGMIHIRDFVEVLAGPLAHDENNGEKRVSRVDLTVQVSSSDLIRPVLFVPPSMPALDLLVRMQASRTHMALVIDEYGGTDGLVSIEDIVEVIVGNIEDEHDEDEAPLIEEGSDKSLTVDARADLEDVFARLGFDLADAEDRDDVDTIGGFVTSVAGRVPRRGEVVTDDPRFEFDILDADPRRVKRIRIRPRRGDGTVDFGVGEGVADPI